MVAIFHGLWTDGDDFSTFGVVRVSSPDIHVVKSPIGALDDMVWIAFAFLPNKCRKQGYTGPTTIIKFIP